eukprot:1156822-Pelagomonas_calceolata.AAC.1
MATARRKAQKGRVATQSTHGNQQSQTPVHTQLQLPARYMAFTEGFEAFRTEHTSEVMTDCVVAWREGANKEDILCLKPTTASGS